MYTGMCYNVYVQNWSLRSDTLPERCIPQNSTGFSGKTWNLFGIKNVIPRTWECVRILAWITGHESGRLFL